MPGCLTSLPLLQKLNAGFVFFRAKVRLVVLLVALGSLLALLSIPFTLQIDVCLVLLIHLACLKVGLFLLEPCQLYISVELSLFGITKPL